MTERVVIIGGGHGAGQCAVSLRQKGWSGEIVIIAEEDYPPYQRPPLSKAYLAGELDASRLLFRPAEFYEKENIDLRLGLRAESVDRSQKLVRTSDGNSVVYSHLVFATGGRVRKLSAPGADLDGIGYVRSIDDIDRLKTKFREGAKMVVVGAGYIGLETAAVARKCGLDVTVLEMADRVLSRVTSPAVSAYFEKLHTEHGVDLRLGAGLAGFKGEGKVERAHLSSGEELECDIAVVGIGIIPNDDLAAVAGLSVNDGIVVDEYAQTSDPSIYAIGDCTRHPSEYFGGELRLESVHNALEQAKTAAMSICGQPVRYNQAPWFWSDQYDVKLQTVGICTGRYDREIVRGDQEAGKFSIFYMAGDRVVAVDSINAPADHMAARKLIEAGMSIADEVIEDAATPLMAFLKKSQ